MGNDRDSFGTEHMKKSYLSKILAGCLAIAALPVSQAALNLPGDSQSTTYAFDDAKSSAKPITHPFKWEKTSTKAFKEAKDADVPVAILFTGTSWCGYCKALEKEVLSKLAFKNGLKGLVVGLMCVADSPGKFKSKDAEKMAKKYGVSGYPTMVLVSADGTEVGRMTGFSPGTAPETYLDQLKQQAGVK
jgi:thiol-disulfide isomerase/thioredoxin